MSWTSAGYSYTKEEIQKTAFAAGCGNGWFWIHKLPNMFLGGYINDDGSYELTFYKAIKSQFDYFMRLTINDQPLFNIQPKDISYKILKLTSKGKLENANRAVIKMYCGDKHCDNGAGGSNGKIILDVQLYKAPTDFILSEGNVTNFTAGIIPTWNEGSRKSKVKITIDTQYKETEENGREVIFYNLESATTYLVQGELYDGVTKLYSNLYITTKYPLVWIFINGKWYLCLPYIFTNGEWKPTKLLVNNNNKWKECDYK